jgi:ABC-type multidrug transport system fused ATPase/permease subunit
MEKGKSLTPLKKYAAKVVLAPFLKLFEVATELLSPFLVRYIIDDGIKNNNLSYALMLTGIMLGLSVLGFGVTMIAQYLAARVSSDFGYDLRKDVYHQMTSLSERQLNDFGKGKILTLLSNDAFSLQNGVMMFMRLFLRPPFLLIGSCILSFIVDYPGRAHLPHLDQPFGAAVLLLVMALSPKHYAAIQGNLDEITTLSSDSLKGARPIRAFNKEGFEEEKFQKSIDSYEKKEHGDGEAQRPHQSFDVLLHQPRPRPRRLCREVRHQRWLLDDGRSRFAHLLPRLEFDRPRDVEPFDRLAQQSLGLEETARSFLALKGSSKTSPKRERLWKMMAKPRSFPLMTFR